MIYQNDKRLKPIIQKSGCYELSILSIFQELAKKELTPEEINQIHDVTARVEYIGDDGFINYKGIRGLSQIASGLAGVSVYMRQVGLNDNFNYRIARFSRQTSGGMYHHFVRVDDDNVIWDPWPNSRTVCEGNITGYRYIFGEVI